MDILKFCEPRICVNGKIHEHHHNKTKTTMTTIQAPKLPTQEQMSVASERELKKVQEHDVPLLTISVSSLLSDNSEQESEERDEQLRDVKSVMKLDERSEPSLSSIVSDPVGEQGQQFNKDQLDGENDDERSLESTSTLLSELSSKASSIISDTDSLEQLFNLRDKIFKELVAGKDPDYIRFATKHEASMRTRLLEHYSQSRSQRQLLVNMDIVNKDKYKKTTSPTYLERLGQAVLFDHSATGYVSIMLYCSYHLCLYELTVTLVEALTHSYKNEDTIHILLLLSGMMLLRLSGGIFEWLDGDRHAAAKKTMRRRLQEGAPDARLIKWFRRYPLLKLSTTVIGYCICLAVVAHFQHRCLGYFFDSRQSVIQGLPSIQDDDVMTDIKEKLLGIDGEDLDEGEIYLHTVLSASSVDRLMGDGSAVLVSSRGTVLFFTTTATLSILLHYMLGHTFEV